MTELPSRPPAVPFVTLTNWVKAAATCGFNIQPLLQQIGIETNLLNLNTVLVDMERLNELMSACVAQARGRHFPFVLGEQFAFEYLPDMETFIATSPTLRDATRVFEWVRMLIDPRMQVTLHERDKEAQLVLEFVDRGRVLKLQPYLAEATFACIVKFGRSLIGEQGHFARISFCHPRPTYATECERFFDMPVAFEETHNSLHFPRKLLDRALRGAYPELHQQAESLIGQRLLRQTGKADFSTQIDELLSARPQLLGQGIEALAAALQLHPRTLQRRLQDEGSSYADRLAKMRFHLASEWLQHSDINIETISELLGFSDRRSFTHAFTRWSGMSPSAFRSKRGEH